MACARMVDILDWSGLREKREWGVDAWLGVSFQLPLDWKSWLLTHAFIVAHQRVVNTVEQYQSIKLVKANSFFVVAQDVLTVMKGFLYNQEMSH